MLTQATDQTLPPIELELWKPNPDKPGYCMFERMATVGEVRDRCIEALDQAGLEEDIEGLSIMQPYSRLDDWPRSRFVACFAVRGSSEGHYVHVEAVALTLGEYRNQTNERRLVLLCKTFSGVDRALAVAAALTRAFYD
ncbi:MAG: hypothetical protein EOM91_21390 [Sphingobacteriia bacterium]|nr:hypothetical protein [Sphingobacteriia bacterium]